MRHWVERGLLLIIFIELCLQVASFGRYVWTKKVENQTLRDRVSRMWAYRDSLYVEIDHEEGKLTQDYQPFIGWKTREHQSDLINVDAEGIRKTIGNPSQEISGLPNVYFFGGSSMWGVGNADDTTIPSLIALQLNNVQPRAAITNYGEIGYGITQEIIRLAELLKSGKRPNTVVFYDGCNDLFLTALENVPHETFRDTTMRKVLGNIWALPREGSETVSNKTIFSGAFWKDIISRIQLIRYPMEYFRSPQNQQITRQSPEKLTSILVQTYTSNIEIVDALSRVYGFKYLFVWQPTLYSRDPADMTNDEKQLPDATHVRYQELATIYHEAAKQIGTTHPQNFYDLSYIFNEVTESVFTDSCHVTPEGNSKAGAAIIRELGL